MAHGGEIGRETPVFVISVAARLAGAHPQTLRQYDRLGLVVPGRARGRGRRYSQADIAALREVQRLSAQGVSLAGIKQILALEAENRVLRAELERLRGLMDASWRVFRVAPGGEATAVSRARARARRTAAPADNSRALTVYRPR
jgi:MerR family transcriptional regulator/heat shock protein HspR